MQSPEPETIDLETMDKWYADNFEDLVKKHGGQNIAVVNEKIVAVEDTEKKAHMVAKKTYPDSTPLVIYIPIEEELECLL